CDTGQQQALMTHSHDPAATEAVAARVGKNRLLNKSSGIRAGRVEIREYPGILGRRETRSMWGSGGAPHRMNAVEPSRRRRAAADRPPSTERQGLASASGNGASPPLVQQSDEALSRPTANCPQDRLVDRTSRRCVWPKIPR